MCHRPRVGDHQTDAAERAARRVPRGVQRHLLVLLTDRGYNAGWIRALRRGAWANIPPRGNRKDAPCFSPHLYRAHNLVIK